VPARENLQYKQLGKKSQNRNISPIWEEAPAERIRMKICAYVEFGDKSWTLSSNLKNFRDFDVIMGQNSPFPVDFARGPYHSAAIPRCL